ncbi:MAG: hypothetical protein U0350_41665 [Caldilineaceae bacterium]
MNEHAKIQEQLAVFDTLDSLAHQQVERHVQSCAECQATLVAYQKMDAALHQFANHQLGYLATQPLVKPKFTAVPTRHGQARRRSSWLLGMVPALSVQRRFVMLEVAGASLFIFLLMLLSMFFLSGGEPNVQQRLASTPTVAEPTATATPTTPSLWTNQLAVQTAPAAATAQPSLALAGSLTNVRLSSSQWDWAGEQFAAHLRRSPLLENGVVAPWDWDAAALNV